MRSVNLVVLKDPLEESTLEFLWPVKIEVAPSGHVIVRFVVLEKNIPSYFDRPHYVTDKGLTEADVLRELVDAGTLASTDLHAGVKKLWEDGFMDSPKTKYKKPLSLASEAMDEELGIREHNPELFELLKSTTLFSTLFLIPDEQEISVSALAVDPSRGTIGFPRYTEKGEDVDVVVQRILENN